MSFVGNIRVQYSCLFALAFLLYANTLYHGFVLDDDVVIVSNSYTQQGVEGIPAIFSHDSFAGFGRVGEGESLLEGGRYRPLSLIFFAVIFNVFGINPLSFHLFSILAYAFAGLMMFKLLLIMFTKDTSGSWIPFLSVILFLVHPIHTEVVANVKSVDETLALLFGMGALYGLFKSIDGGSKKWVLLSFISMLLACLAKENAASLVVVAPLAVWYFRKSKVGTILIQVLPLVAGVFLFLLIRQSVLGDLSQGRVMHDPLNNPFLQWVGNAWTECSPGTKAATILYTLGMYLKLMIIPYPLTHDYYPFQIELQSFSSPVVWLSLLLLVLMLGYGIWSIRGRVKTGFGILFFLMTGSITANIFFPVGTFMAERFLFLPSFGFLLSAVLLGFQVAGEKRKKLMIALFGVVAIFFSMVTILRNPAWKDNETLLRTDLEYSPNSAKLQNDLGTIMLVEAMKNTDPAQQQLLFQEALPHLKRAIVLHPTYYDAYLAFGACSYYLQQFEPSVQAYRTACQLFPGDIKSNTGLVYALQAYGRDQWIDRDTISSLNALEEAWKIQQDTATAMQLSRYYQSMGESEKSMEWAQKSRGNGFIN